MHTAFPNRSRARDDVLDAERVVENGFGVGHAAHRREPAECRRARSAGDVLFLLEPGFAQVHVDVDEAGNDDLAAQVAFDPLLHREIMPDLDDPAVADEDLADLVQNRPAGRLRARS